MTTEQLTQGISARQEDQVKQQNILEIQHRQWLQQPVTQHLLRVLSKYRDLTLASIISNTAIGGEPDKQKHNSTILGAQLSTCDRLTNIISDTSTFLQAKH